MSMEFKLTLNKIIGPDVEDGSILVYDKSTNTLKGTKIYIREPKEEEEEEAAIPQEFFKVHGAPLGENYKEYLVYDNELGKTVYSNVVLGSGGGAGGVDLVSPQTITGEKKFSKLKLHNPVEDTNAGNKILVLDSNNQIKKSIKDISNVDLSDYVTMNTSQTVSGEKTFSKVKLSGLTGDSTASNSILVLDSANQIKKSSKLFSDIGSGSSGGVTLDTTQTITGEKSFSKLKLNSPTIDTTGGNNILVLDSNNQVKKTDKLYSDLNNVITLDTTQTITGEKFFNILKLGNPADDTTSTNNLLVLDSNNQIKKSNKLHSDVGSGGNYVTLDGTETITGEKTVDILKLGTSVSSTDSTSTNNILVLDVNNQIKKADKLYSDIGGSLANYVTITDSQNITGQKTFGNLRLSGLADSTTATNNILVLDSNNQIQKSDKLYSDLSNYVTTGTNQIIPGEKIFSNLKLIGLTDDATATNNILVLDSSGQIQKSDIVYSEIITSSSASSITGEKTFSSLKLSGLTDDATATNNVLVLDSDNQIKKSDKLYSDLNNVITLDGTETITGEKTFNNSKLNITPDNTGTNKFVILDGTNTLRACSKTIDDFDVLGGGEPPDMSNYVSLDGVQTITGEKTINTLKLGTSTADTASTNTVLVLDSNNQIKKSDKLYSDIGGAPDLSNYMTLDGMQSITGEKTFDAVKLNGLTDDATATNNVLVLDSSSRIQKSDKVYSDIVTVGNAQNIPGEKTFDNLRLSGLTDETTATNNVLVLDMNNQVKKSDILYSNLSNMTSFVTLSDPQSITGEKTFGNLRLSGGTDNTTSTNNVLVLDSNNQIQKSDKLYSDIGNPDLSNFVTLDGVQSITGEKTFNSVKLNGLTDNTATTNNILVLDSATNQIRKSGKLYSDLTNTVTLDTIQSVTGEKTFSDVKLSGLTDDSTTTNNILVLDSSHQIKKSNLTYSTVANSVTLDTTQTVTGEKLFDNLKLNSPVDDTTNTNSLVVLDSNNQIKKSDLVYSNMVRLDASQTITGEKLFNDLKLNSPTDDTTNTNNLAVLDVNNQIKKSDLIYSNIVLLNASQTIIGEKLFDDLKLNSPTDDTTNTNNLAVLDSNNQIKKSDLVYSSMVILDTSQTITGEKLFDDLKLNSPVDDTTNTNNLAVLDSNNQIKKSDLVYSNMVILDTSQTITGEKLYDDLKLNSPIDDSTVTNSLLVLDSNNQIKKSDRYYSDIFVSVPPIHLSRSAETLENNSDTSSYLGINYGSNFVSNTNGYLITDGPVVIFFDQKTDAHSNVQSRDGNTFSYIDPHQLFDTTKSIFQIIDNSSSGVVHPDSSAEVGASPAIKHGLYQLDYSLLLYSDKTETFPFDIEFKLFQRSATVDLGNGVGVPVEIASEIQIFSQIDYKRINVSYIAQVFADDLQIYATIETSVGSGGVKLLPTTYCNLNIRKIANNPS